MKSQKGITLLSLIIYITAVTIVIAILGIVSNFFYDNKAILYKQSEYIAEYNKFNMHFIEDVKNNKTAQVQESKITFADGTIYTYKLDDDKGIYRNNVKICSNIDYCKFETSRNNDTAVEKQLIKVHMIIQESESFEAENEYVLKYW